MKSIFRAQSLENEGLNSNINNQLSDEDFARKIQEDLDKELANQYQNE